MKPASFIDPLSKFLSGRNAKLFGLGVSAVLVLLVIRALYLERHQLAEIEIDREFMLAGTLSVFVVALGNVLGSVASWLLLRRHSGAITLAYSLTINGLSQMAKYVPGNFLHLAGRFYLISRLVGAKTAFFFSVFEVLLLCLAACSLGLFYLPYLQPVEWSLPVIGVLSLLVPGAGIYVLARTGLLNVSIADLIAVMLLYLLSFLCYGQAFEMLFGLVFNVHSVTATLCAVLFALAFVVGYVTPGASGGLGVREFAFMVLARPLMDESPAIAAVVLFRLFSIAGDLAFSASTLLVKKFCHVKLMQE